MDEGNKCKKGLPIFFLFYVLFEKRVGFDGDFNWSSVGNQFETVVEHLRHQSSHNKVHLTVNYELRFSMISISRWNQDLKESIKYHFNFLDQNSMNHSINWLKLSGYWIQSAANFVYSNQDVNQVLLSFEGTLKLSPSITVGKFMKRVL